MAFLLTMLAANILAGSFFNELPEQTLQIWGVSHHTLSKGDLLRLFTACFLSDDIGMFVRQFIFASATIGFVELKLGSLRTAISFFVINSVATLSVIFLGIPLMHWLVLAEYEGLLVRLDNGMSAGGFGMLGILIAQMKHSKLVLVAIVACIFAKMMWDFEPISDSVHLVGFLLGVFCKCHRR